MSEDSGASIRFPTRALALTEQLRGAILSGDIAPGTHLRQAELAKQYGISVTPVREAFAALAQEGYVVQDVHRGVVVFTPSASDLAENLEIRTALESMAAELAAECITPQQMDSVDALNEEMRRCQTSDLLRIGTELSPRFHAEIYAATGRQRLTSLIHQYRQVGVSYARLLALAPDPTEPIIQEVQQEHDAICAALRAGDKNAAGASMRHHLECNRRRLLSALNRIEHQR